MKLEITNAFHNTSYNVTPRSELSKFFNRPVYQISESTFRRLVKSLCGAKDCNCGVTYGDKNYRLIKWDYNFRGQGDQSEYYIEVLK